MLQKKKKVVVSSQQKNYSFKCIQIERGSQEFNLKRLWIWLLALVQKKRKKKPQTISIRVFYTNILQTISIRVFYTNIF